jgi:hypothetical protein
MMNVRNFIDSKILAHLVYLDDMNLEEAFANCKNLEKAVDSCTPRQEVRHERVHFGGDARNFNVLTSSKSYVSMDWFDLAMRAATLRDSIWNRANEDSHWKVVDIKSLEPCFIDLRYTNQIWGMSGVSGWAATVNDDMGKKVAAFLETLKDGMANDDVKRDVVSAALKVTQSKPAMDSEEQQQEAVSGLIEQVNNFAFALLKAGDFVKDVCSAFYYIGGRTNFF